MKLSGIAIVGGVIVVSVVGPFAVKELAEFQQRRADEAAAVAYYQEDRSPQAIARHIATQQAIPKKITHALYMSVGTGMSVKEVTAILGPGTELSRNDLAGYTTMMYQWVNPDRSNMNVMFQNDRVVQKAQFGLR